ncbi:MAG: heavy-metal-associated domain-containing protein [Hyphomicrobiales bacterium]
METLDLNITGMACDKCADRIRLVLKNHTGVRKADIIWQPGTGRITYNSQTTSADRIVATIEGAGFTVARG